MSDGEHRQADPQVCGGADRASGAGAGGAATTAAIPRNPVFGACQEAGIRAGEVVGWRGWSAHPPGSIWLRSLFMDFHVWWPGQVMVADLMGPMGHGIHAFKDPRRAAAYVGVGARQGHHIIIGRVKLWGEIYEHEHGYRAQFAKIDAIDGWVKSAGSKGFVTEDKHVRELRRVYGVGHSGRKWKRWNYFGLSRWEVALLWILPLLVGASMAMLIGSIVAALLS